MTGRYRWVVLGLGITAQAAFAALLAGLPALGPALRSEYSLSLAGFGTALGAVTFGGMLTLVPWGLLTDRLGERLSISVGLTGAAASLGAASLGGRSLLVTMLFLAGVLGAVANVASGRAVMGWFAFSERGMAFGLRQAAVPLGGALASITLPALAARGDARVGLVALAAGCFVAAVACAGWLREPPSGARSGGGRGPLRDRRVYRLAVGSGCLVSLQAAVIGFTVLFLHDQRGLSDVAAGAVLAVIQVVGVVLRIAVGRWSDRVGRRLSLLRRTAGLIAVVWLVTPFLFGAPVGLLIPVVVLAGAITFAWNGLSFAAAAELAEPGRSGTAIAVQQTALFAVAALVPPLFGAAAAATSYRVAFWAAVAGPVLGWILLRPLALAERPPADPVPA